MTTRYFPRDRKGGTPFRSKADGFNRAVRHWVCQSCRAVYTAKHAQCRCGHKVLYYFASGTEFRRFCQLAARLDRGMIDDLVLQKNYPVEINGALIFTYRADFVYLDKGSARTIIEDAKPKRFRDPLYMIKKKAVEAYHHITITEVEA